MASSLGKQHRVQPHNLILNNLIYGNSDLKQWSPWSEFAYAYIHISWRNQAATGWAWFNCGYLHVNGWCLLGMGHLFYFVCKANQVIICQHWKTWQGAGVNLQSLSFRSDGSNASYSFSHLQWPFLVFPHRIVNGTETKNSWNYFFLWVWGYEGGGARGRGERATLMKCAWHVQPWKPCKLFPNSRLSSIIQLSGSFPR